MDNVIFSFFKGKSPPSVKWEEVREQILSTIEEEKEGLVVIKPFEYEDMLAGHKVSVEVSPYYSKLSVGDREYYFERETGEFDGAAFPLNNH
ncbi:hypothetical protein ES703_101672 [subsurface metagenome]